MSYREPVVDSLGSAGQRFGSALLEQHELANAKIRAVWHEFSADNGSADYGSELNLVATRQFAKRFLAGIKYADFRANTFRVDATKIWLFVQFKYTL